MRNSILDDLGQEVTGIVSPVTICMTLTVLLVRLLNPDGATSPSAIAIAQTYYKEQVHPNYLSDSFPNLRVNFALLSKQGWKTSPIYRILREEQSIVPSGHADSLGY